MKAWPKISNTFQGQAFTSFHLLPSCIFSRRNNDFLSISVHAERKDYTNIIFPIIAGDQEHTVFSETNAQIQARMQISPRQMQANAENVSWLDSSSTPESYSNVEQIISLFITFYTGGPLPICHAFVWWTALGHWVSIPCGDEERPV